MSQLNLDLVLRFQSLKIDALQDVPTTGVLALALSFQIFFELCISDSLQKYLYSSDHQLGFKRKSSCAHAIYVVRKTVEYYVSNDSTVNICTLDISKAFDKLNIHSLLLKLMKRRLPVNFVVLFQRWLCNVFIKVRWGSCLSKLLRLFSGVRQGGILSPVFFLHLY